MEHRTVFPEPRQGGVMLYEVDSTKTIDQVCRGLEKAVVDHKFGVMMVHNLKETMKKKGVEFAEDRDIMKRKLV